MSAKVIQHPSVQPWAVWPGHAEVNRTGATIARDMLAELESVETDDDSPIDLAEYSNLENWPREGRPFRNVVAEYSVRAQAAGPEALEGFFAVLSDFAAQVCQGIIPSSGFYDRFTGESPGGSR